jgi:hypothetical protein
MLPTMFLTRYLYDKAKVETTLYHAILQRDYPQSAFWAYELYFSGFEQEVVEQLNEIYRDRFEKNHRKLGLYFQKKQAELKGKPELIATLLKNLMKNPDVLETPGVKFINVKPHHIESFMTKEPKGPRWNFLREVCLYRVLGECSQEYRMKYRQDWLSCVVQTPVWRERMKGYENWTEDEEEAFHNRWDYEPDEQPLIVQERCMGIISDNII